ncbi:MAG: GAF domain-containing protein [Leptospiraceae bacterium]|nr:GAF domain-containing protein [Leptospiraceae bacterium]MDW8306120.1 HD domain-containing phosphohydrolase [Leptospiraceae bacterium]
MKGENELPLFASWSQMQEASNGHLPMVIWLLSSEELCQHQDSIEQTVREHPEAWVRLIIFSDSELTLSSFLEKLLYFRLSKNPPPHLLNQVLRTLKEIMEKERQIFLLNSKLALSYREMHQLTQVGQALAHERDFHRLIDLILEKARQLVSADGGSLYITEYDNEGHLKQLRFVRSALNLEDHEFSMPVDKKSIAGYVALTGEPLIIDDVHQIPPDAEYSFNAEYDRQHNYYTKSMIVVPMKNHRGEVIGVLQLINKKVNFKQKLSYEELKSDLVIAFSRKDYQILEALAGQAAIAIENNNLIQEIQGLFEGFVKASVTAIEQRDPTTSGHSFRVAEYTVALAEVVDRLREGIFSTVRFSREELRELRYASLLHDFGKVGVREHVLVKAKKLYPHELDLISMRLEYLRKSIEAELSRRLIEKLKKSPLASWDKLEHEFQAELEEHYREIDEMFAAIVEANEPTILEEGSFEFLKRIAQKRIKLHGGEEIPLLTPKEFLALSVRKGNLQEEERKEIESHVTHTYKFLSQIPWTKDLKRVPEIAYGHHEKLDGSGYPQRLTAERIPIQTRMMTIADIFDALTAWDRPYKRAVPPERALDILQMEANQGHIDRQLLQVFIEAGIYRKFEEIRDFGQVS